MRQVEVIPIEKLTEMLGMGPLGVVDAMRWVDKRKIPRYPMKGRIDGVCLDTLMAYLVRDALKKAGIKATGRTIDACVDLSVILWDEPVRAGEAAKRMREKGHSPSRTKKAKKVLGVGSEAEKGKYGTFWWWTWPKAPVRWPDPESHEGMRLYRRILSWWMRYGESDLENRVCIR